ncbi:hypothetical protein BC332_19937 [Capsicum chinense]|nr:hypothetical protein BC332_19937 [Capsicum chinense]
MSNGTRVLPPPYGVDSAWFGAKLIGNLKLLPHFLVCYEKAISA